MATEYVIEGPKGMVVGQVDTSPQFAVDTKWVTAEIGTNKKRTYRYAQFHTSATAGKAVVLGSVGNLLFEGVVTNVINQRVAIPQIALTSPTAGPNYTPVQTAGYFDTVGALCVSSTAGTQLFASATAGSSCTVPTATMPVRYPGAIALTNVAADNAYIYAADELKAVADLLS